MAQGRRVIRGRYPEYPALVRQAFKGTALLEARRRVAVVSGLAAAGAAKIRQMVLDHPLLDYLRVGRARGRQPVPVVPAQALGPVGDRPRLLFVLATRSGGDAADQSGLDDGPGRSL